MTATFRVKNFEKFQHYKDRSPPWIKLYNETLDDYEFGRLRDASKMHLVGIWLLASRSDNCLPLDPEWIGKRINATEPVDLRGLVDAGFLIENQPLQIPEHVASKAQAKCLTREETEESRGEKSRAEAARDLGRKVRAKVGALLNSPSITQFNRIDAWLESGADPERDIYPSIEAGLKKLGKPPATLKYFDGMISDARDARKAPMPAGNPRKRNEPAEIDPLQVETNLWFGRLTVGQIGKWDERKWGPHPSDPNNWIPPDIRETFKDLIANLSRPKEEAA